MIEKAIMIEGDGKKLPKKSGNFFFFKLAILLKRYLLIFFQGLPRLYLI